MLADDFKWCLSVYSVICEMENTQTQPIPTEII